jgi:dTDP-4-dehydrorhamnose 3,5-epimerase
MNFDKSSGPVVEIVKKFYDSRGYFSEVGSSSGFSQTNVSVSKKNVLRGMHYQEEYPQKKEILVLSGEIFDAWVDVRPYSKTFGKAGWRYLSEGTSEKLVVPRGFAHGFLAVSDMAKVIYCVDYPRVESDERCVRWDSCGIPWPLEVDPILSEKDANATPL